MTNRGKQIPERPTELDEITRNELLPSNSLYDPVDRRIMELLQRDGRLSNSEVARSLGLSEPTVRRRISRLIETGILRIVGVINPEAVGYTISAVIGVNSALQQLDEVAKTIASFSEIHYLGYSTGSFDFIIEGFFYSHQHLLDFLRTKLGAISGITATETAIILKMAKFSYEWELPLEAQG